MIPFHSIYFIPGESEYTYAVVTTDPLPEIEYIHDRMPLILCSSLPESTLDAINQLKSESDQNTNNSTDSNNSNNNTSPDSNSVPLLNEKAEMWLNCNKYSVEHVLPLLLQHPKILAQRISNIDNSNNNNSDHKDGQVIKQEETEDRKESPKREDKPWVTIPKLESYKGIELINPKGCYSYNPFLLF